MFSIAQRIVCLIIILVCGSCVVSKPQDIKIQAEFEKQYEISKSTKEIIEIPEPPPPPPGTQLKRYFRWNTKSETYREIYK